MTTISDPKKNVLSLSLTKALPGIIMLAAIIFLPAWTFNYWQGWVYLAVLLTPMILVFIYMVKNDPETLERRLRMKEKVKKQKSIISLTIPLFLLAFILPGFDVRLGWSHVPAVISIIAAALVLLGYGIVFVVIRENRFASRLIEVAQGQKVIETGPYALVRHPMYSGMILFILMTPLALGSWWAMIPAAAAIPLIAARGVNEEKVLAADLPGYTDYLKKVKYRLLPGIW